MADEHALDQLIRRSREARAAHDMPASIALLQDAAAVAHSSQPEREAQVIWLLTKAAWDSESIDVLITCVAQLVAMPDPFAGSRTAREMAEPVARRLYDMHGYGDCAPDRLLAEAAEAWRNDGDRVRAEWVVIQAAWAQACRGELDALFSTAARLDRLRPGDLDGSPSRHARAGGARDSVAWLQLDIWRTALRGAVWTRQSRRVAEALDSLEDAVEACGLARESDAFLLENICTAQALIGDPSPHDMAAWLHAIEALTGPRAATHKALHDAWKTRDDGERFWHAARCARSSHVGYEWVAWALQGAVLTGDTEAWSALDDLAVNHGVTAFASGL